MKTINDFKALLFKNGSNTLLGMHLNGLFPSPTKKDNYFEYDATVHNLDEKIEVIVQMNKNGIDAFKDSYKMGSVSKAFYQWNLAKFGDFK